MGAKDDVVLQAVIGAVGAGQLAHWRGRSRALLALRRVICALARRDPAPAPPARSDGKCGSDGGGGGGGGWDRLGVVRGRGGVGLIEACAAEADARRLRAGPSHALQDHHTSGPSHVLQDHHTSGPSHAPQDHHVAAAEAGGAGGGVVEEEVCALLVVCYPLGCM